MQVKHIIADGKSSRGYGNCNDGDFYRGLTDAVRLLANKSSWDVMMGRMTICATEGYLTLPREVEKIMGATINGTAAWPRDLWFRHHINGPGNLGCGNGFNEFYDEVGKTPIFRCIQGPTVLFAIPESAEDNGKELLIYGYDRFDSELFHTDTDGNVVNGMRVPINTSEITNYPDARVIKKVTHVFKPETKGVVRLWGYVDPFDISTVADLYGYYYADETQPTYRQYRFPKCSTVDITFRRKNLEFKSLEDWIPFDNRLALLQSLKAVREYDSGNSAKGVEYELLATRMLIEEEKAYKQYSGTGPQVRNFSAQTNERLRGGYRNGRGRR